MNNSKDMKAKLYAGLTASFERLVAFDKAQNKPFTDKVESGYLSNGDTIAFKRPSEYVSQKKYESKPTLHKIVRSYERGEYTASEMIGRIMLLEDVSDEDL